MTGCRGMQGVDTRRSGHYEYFSVDPTVSSENNLHAKNKTVVKRWLQQQKGAQVTADRGIIARIAEPPESSICNLLLTHGVGKLAAGVAAKLQEGLQAPEEPGAAPLWRELQTSRNRAHEVDARAWHVPRGHIRTLLLTYCPCLFCRRCPQSASQMGLCRGWPEVEQAGVSEPIAGGPKAESATDVMDPV